MIRTIDFDRRPIKVGEWRPLTPQGDGPFVVEIKCFVDNPPPPGYKACDECGKFEIENNETIQITPSPSIFSQSPGRLDITVRDRTGDQREFSLMVFGDYNQFVVLNRNPSEAPPNVMA